MLSSGFKKFFLTTIDIYKKCISPFLPDSCRFYPSCSDYSASAIEEYGVMKGLWLTLLRLGRCHPLCTGGYDPLHK